MSEYINLSGLKTLLEPLVHLINKKAERPDWNENDPNSSSYIANRTHYEETNFKQFLDTSISLDSNGIYDIYPSSFSLQEGNSYKVIWDGITYDCIARYDGWGSFYIGNQEFAVILGGWDFPEVIESNEPFFIATIERYDETIFFGVEGNHTITLSGEDTIIHKIDEKYLPNLVGAKGTGEGAEVFNDYENNVASGDYAHAEGTYISSHRGMILSTASGAASHSEGRGCVASGGASHAEGFNTIASGDYAHAEGGASKATGDNSHAEGSVTIASGRGSHAEGYKSQAIGSYAHAEGENTVANGDYQHVQGKYNVPDSENIYAHIVGNGTNTGNEENIHTLDWDGNAWFKGDVLVGGLFGTGTYGCIGSKKLATEEYVDEKLALVISNSQIDALFEDGFFPPLPNASGVSF